MAGESSSITLGFMPVTTGFLGGEQGESAALVNDTEVVATNVSNCTNDYCLSDEEYVNMIQDYIFPTTLEWIFIVIYVMVFIFGLIGNFLVCFVVWRNQNMKTVTNIFIVNLSVADFLVILICMPPTVLGDVTETWYIGGVMCKIIKYIQVSHCRLLIIYLLSLCHT